MTKSTLTGPIAPSNRYGEGLDTALHARLERAANKLLAKAGFFDEPDADHSNFDDLFGEAEYQPMEAEACGVHGLRPTWHGRA